MIHGHDEHKSLHTHARAHSHVKTPSLVHVNYIFLSHCKIILPDSQPSYNRVVIIF